MRTSDAGDWLMVKINLLPHRQIKRAERQREFGLMATGVAVAAIAVIFLGWTYINANLSAQQERNARLDKAIAVLDKEIADIKKLQGEIQSLLARKAVVENLQTSRSQAVVILDQVARQLPNGIILKSIKQQASTVTLQGLADTQARVSTLSKNLEDSTTWVEGTPVIGEIKSVTINNIKQNEFTLNFNLKMHQPISDKTPSIQKAEVK